jgi:metallo-beta-lactamase class B
VTVEKIKNDLPDLKFIIPGHGNPGGKELLDYTVELFRK